MQATRAATVEVARALGARQVVFQCPARFTPTGEHVTWLTRFLGRAARADLVPAWEPRGAWPRDLVAGQCAELDLVHGVDPLREAARSRGLWTFRLHGVTGFRDRHTDADLGIIAGHLAPAGPSYMLFNNRRMGEDAVRLQALFRTPPDDPA